MTRGQKAAIFGVVVNIASLTASIIALIELTKAARAQRQLGTR